MNVCVRAYGLFQSMPSFIVSKPSFGRLLYLMECSFIQKRAVLLMGGAGTAKTVTIEQFLTAYAQRPDQDLFTWKKSNFSSATTPGLFQSVVEDVIEKRMGTTYGPKRNMRMCLFVDDLNMPEINEWGDQITNEIVRQVTQCNVIGCLFYALCACARLCMRACVRAFGSGWAGGGGVGGSVGRWIGGLVGG